jgi:molybdopterin-guanine dinucleotide biosynthesis protein A
MLPGLVPAAGASRRLGEAKQLLPCRGRTLGGQPVTEVPVDRPAPPDVDTRAGYERLLR